MDMVIFCKDAALYSNGSKAIRIECNDVDLATTLTSLPIREVIDAFGEEEFLREIGKETAIDYFDIKEAEE